MTTVDEANACVARAGRSKDYTEHPTPVVEANSGAPIVLGNFHGRTPDRYVTGFGGRMVPIYQPIGTPKPREDCQPFTFELATSDTSAPGMARRPRSVNVKGQEKFVKGLNTLLAKQAREAAKRAKLAAKTAA